MLLRADQPGLAAGADRPTVAVIVENLQAAETLADQRRSWPCSTPPAFPASRALALIAELAQARRGCCWSRRRPRRRAYRRARPERGAALELDRHGQLPGTRDADPWPADGVSTRGLTAALTGPAGALARACLARGYPVEQELATAEAIQALTPRRAEGPG